MLFIQYATVKERHAAMKQSIAELGTKTELGAIENPDYIKNVHNLRYKTFRQVCDTERLDAVRNKVIKYKA